MSDSGTSAAPLEANTGLAAASNQLPEAPVPQPTSPAEDTVSSPAFFSALAPAPAISPSTATATSKPDMSADFGDESSDSAADYFGAASTKRPVTGQVPLQQCPYDQTHARECRMHWHDLLLDAAAYDAFQDVGNLYSGYTYRFQTTHGKWFDRWINSAAGWRWTRWDDGNPFLDDYVGHSMMGAITNFIWIQNDPKGMTLVQSNSKEYRERLFRAFLFSTAFSFEWKLGPFGEASIGHNGDYYQYENSSIETPTNETGWVELVTTPVGGALWTIGEDALDQHLIARLEEKNNNPLLLVMYQFLSPARATANVFRFRAPWYRDTRRVHASRLFDFHDRIVRTDATEYPGVSYASAEARTATSSTSSEPHRFGGGYEFGALIGASLTHDSALGSDENNKYMDIIVRASALLKGNSSVALRYSPEVIAVAMLDEPLPYNANPKLERTRTYGTGFSPEGFQVVFRPTNRVQPFLDQHLGAIGFYKPVLLATRPGNNAIYNVNFGAGINIVRVNGNAVSFGYRFQHMAAFAGPQANGTDAHSFYISVSRFFKSQSQAY